MSDRIPHLRGHRPRRWTGPGVVMLALGLLALTGCRDILTEPAPAGPASLAISVVMPEGTGAIPDFLARSEGPAATPGAAFDRADRVRIELRGSRGTRVDLDQAFRSEGALTRVRLELDLSEDEEMAIALELRYQGAPLFEAQGTARMTPGESTEAQLTLVGVVARIQVSEEPILLQALGDDFALSGQGVFASGQAVPGAVPTWESLNPQVARIVGGNRVQALSNGRTEVVARLGSLAESILVVVEQRVAIVELEPALLELDVLEVALLRVQLRDSNGNPIPPGNRVDWTTSDPRVAEVDADGRVRALAPGSAEVSALVDGVTGTAAVVVRELEPPEIVTQLLPDGRVGESYLGLLAATGGATPYAWSLESGLLPAGLVLNPASGEITGTPTLAGTESFTIRVTGGNGASTTRLFTLTILPLLRRPELEGGWLGISWNGLEFPVIEETLNCTILLERVDLDFRPDGTFTAVTEETESCLTAPPTPQRNLILVDSGTWSVPSEGRLELRVTLLRDYVNGELVFESPTDFLVEWEYELLRGSLLISAEDSEGMPLLIEFERGTVLLPSVALGVDHPEPAVGEAYSGNSANNRGRPSPFRMTWTFR